MKVKLKSIGELQAVYGVVAAMAAAMATEASRADRPGERPHLRMAGRLVALEVHRFALGIAMKLATPSERHSLGIKPASGLALLSAWYALDSTEINDPLAFALMSEIMDNLERAYGGTIVNHKSKQP